jgi:hypothetical protein
MDDWIRFQRGDYSTGWPRYPGATFVGPDATSAHLRSAHHPVHVIDPRQPVELAAHAGMRRWDGQEALHHPLLVWFNFKDSLGGEILASRLVPLLRKRCQAPLVLACAARLTSLLQATFPECRVVDKAADVRPLARSCSSYVLARDLLGLLVSSDADFAALAGEQFKASTVGSAEVRAAGGRPRIALSWKTTNRNQGRYRNIPLTELAAVLGRHDVEWHVAQHGDLADDVGELRHTAPDAVIVEGTLHPLGDMAAFAGELRQMDAVVTIDNTLLHLAGAMGIPTIALISTPAYWAWPASGSESRWYASVTLLRQTKPRCWRGVLASLDQELLSRLSPGHAGGIRCSASGEVVDRIHTQTRRYPA